MEYEIKQSITTQVPAAKHTMEWVRCPVCGNKTRVKVRKDTVLLNFPLHCPKCKNVSLIEVENLEIVRIK